MKPKLHSLAFVFALGALVLMNIASHLPAPLLQDVSPTATAATPMPMAGTTTDTNGIAFLGILIFAVIVAAIVIRLRDVPAR
ncbi:MAG: hypothetical protein Fur0016_07670 [Anaerolineales bacterium]